MKMTKEGEVAHLVGVKLSVELLARLDAFAAERARSIGLSSPLTRSQALRIVLEASLPKLPVEEN